jgi:tetratricopeptide (TPR) repeat protein
VPEDKLKDRLVEIATHFAATRDVLAALEPDDPRTSELVRQAKEALDQGRLPEADALLGRAKELEAVALGEIRKFRQRAQEAEDRRALNLAKIEAIQGDIALTQLRHADAAERFEQAAALVPAEHADERANYLFQQAGALYEVGDRRGDNAALRRAVDVYNAVLEHWTHERAPLDWAATQNNLGSALQTLGARGDDQALRRAVAAFEAALEEHTRERAPLDWAMTQNNLGNALQTLGARGDDQALRRAVAAYEAALEELSRQNATAYVAVVTRNLARVRDHLGQIAATRLD